MNGFLFHTGGKLCREGKMLAYSSDALSCGPVFMLIEKFFGGNPEALGKCFAEMSQTEIPDFVCGFAHAHVAFLEVFTSLVHAEVSVIFKYGLVVDSSEATFELVVIYSYTLR